MGRRAPSDGLLPYQRVFTGAPDAERTGGQDLDGRERLVVVPVIAAMLVIGLAPALLVGALDGVAEQVSTTVSADGNAAVGLPAPAFSEGNAK